ncbi:MAG: hypothetical protein Q4C54_05915 [Clostridia bacterium]|nr:hypothetical protein [Clostridia bacterium]
MAESMNIEEMEIPDDAIERIARCLLPALQAFFESDEGKGEFARWLAQREPLNNPAA